MCVLSQAIGKARRELCLGALALGQGHSLISHLLGLRPGEDCPKQAEDPGQTK